MCDCLFWDKIQAVKIGVTTTVAVPPSAMIISNTPAFKDKIVVVPILGRKSRPIVILHGISCSARVAADCKAVKVSRA